MAFTFENVRVALQNRERDTHHALVVALDPYLIPDLQQLVWSYTPHGYDHAATRSAETVEGGQFRNVAGLDFEVNQRFNDNVKRQILLRWGNKPGPRGIIYYVALPHMCKLVAGGFHVQVVDSMQMAYLYRQTDTTRGAKERFVCCVIERDFQPFSLQTLYTLQRLMLARIEWVSSYSDESMNQTERRAFWAELSTVSEQVEAITTHDELLYWLFEHFDYDHRHYQRCQRKRKGEEEESTDV